MSPQESPADSTTPPIQQSLPPAKKGKKQSSAQKAEAHPPKTTSRGEIVRKAAEERLTQEKLALSRRLEEQKLLKEAKNEKKAVKDEPKEGEESPASAPQKKVLPKTIPRWASLSNSSSHNGKSLVERPKMLSILLDAFGDDNVISALSLKEEFKEYYPGNFKYFYAIAVEKAISQGYIKKIKGSFKLIKKKASPRVTLESVLPHVFTWICEPKEASAVMIKKYIEMHYPSLSNDPKGFKKALENGVLKGQLKRITGKGASGTFGLVDGASKTGTRFEDPIEDAIIAMNEPKVASVLALRQYLDEYHSEFGTKSRPHLLKFTLQRLLQRGHLQRVSGKGFSGTLRLSYPYYPSPEELWGDEYEVPDSCKQLSEPIKKKAKLTIKLKSTKKSSKSKGTTPGKKPKKSLKKKKAPFKVEVKDEVKNEALSVV